MASCKECVHYEICKCWSDDLYRQELSCAFDETKICKDFKNKSDFQEVKHGEWKKYDEDIFECSECGYLWYLTNISTDPKDNDAFYCPLCGAKMDGGKSE